MGSGPYGVEEFQRGSFVRLKANPDYWGGAPAFDTVVFKFVTGPAARIAEIESGGSDLTLNIPFQEFDRLKAKPGLEGVATPVSDIAMIFFNDVAAMTDVNVRRAAVMAVGKKAIVDRLLRGYGVPIETLLARAFRRDRARGGGRLHPGDPGLPVGAALHPVRRGLRPRRPADLRTDQPRDRL